MNMEYYYIMYYKEEYDSFQNMISKKKFDDYVEYSKMVPLEYLFYKTFLMSKWNNDK